MVGWYPQQKIIRIINDNNNNNHHHQTIGRPNCSVQCPKPCSLLCLCASHVQTMRPTHRLSIQQLHFGSRTVLRGFPQWTLRGKRKNGNHNGYGLISGLKDRYPTKHSDSYLYNMFVCQHYPTFASSPKVFLEHCSFGSRWRGRHVKNFQGMTWGPYPSELSIFFSYGRLSWCLLGSL